MKIIYNRILFVIIASTCLTLVSSGCSTAKGFGKDVEDLGETIQGE